MTDKFDLSQRTFETRLLFIKELFTHTYSQNDIMAHCITHKLDRSYKSYEEELEAYLNVLINADNSVRFFKRIK